VTQKAVLSLVLWLELFAAGHETDGMNQMLWMALALV
jgi:hypothetical protein